MVVGIIGGSSVVVDPGGVQAFFLARLLVTTAAVFAGALLLFLRAPVPRSRLVCAAVVGLLGTLALSAAVARAPAVALFGASGRQMGVLAWALFAVAFLVGATLYQEGEGATLGVTAATAFSAAVLWVGFYGAFEAAGHPLVTPSQVFPGRLQATFGNPAALGAFLTLALPILASAIAARIRLPLTAPAAAVGLWLLVASGARGAWIGVAAAALYGIGLLIARGSPVSRRAALGLGAGLIALLALTFPTGRWQSALSGFEGRVDTWEVGIRVIAQHPVLGVGPEGFQQAFAENVGDDFVVTYTRDQATDRAHAGLLDLTITGGLVGLLFYAVILSGIIWLLVRALLRSSRVDRVALGMAAAILAYLVQQQAFFQLACLDLVLWFLVGLLAVQLGFSRSLGRGRRALATCGLLISLVALTYTLLGVVADHRDRAALAATTPAQAISDFEAAAVVRPFDSIHALLAVAMLRDTEEFGLLEREVALVDEALRWAPQDGILLLARSGLLVAEFRANGDPAPLLEAEATLLDLTASDRTNGEAYLRLGTIRYYRGDFAAAEYYWLEAARLMPDRQEPRDNLAVLHGS